MNSIDEKRAELKEERRKICKAHGIDYEKVEDGCSKITQLLRDTKTDMKMFFTLQETLNNVNRGRDYWFEIAKLIHNEKFTPKQKALLELFCYLEVSEGILSEHIQLISFILIKNGHEVYNPERRKFVKSYEELDTVSLFIKLEFVKEHGFEFIADTIDRGLRNCIAHLRYVVKEDGAIINKINGEKIEGLDQKTLIMVTMSRIILSCFQEALL